MPTNVTARPQLRPVPNKCTGRKRAPHVFGSIEARWEAKVDRSDPSGCWLWTANKNPSGYGLISAPVASPLYTGKRKNLNRDTNILAHRVSWFIYRGAIPDGLAVLHACDVRACVNPDHLFLGTLLDNSLDMVAKERQKRTLSAKDIPLIRKLRQNGEPFRKIAERFGVANSTITSVIYGKSWRHVA